MISWARSFIFSLLVCFVFYVWQRTLGSTGMPLSSMSYHSAPSAGVHHPHQAPTHHSQYQDWTSVTAAASTRGLHSSGVTPHTPAYRIYPTSHHTTATHSDYITTHDLDGLKTSSGIGGGGGGGGGGGSPPVTASSPPIVSPTALGHHQGTNCADDLTIKGSPDSNGEN